MEQQISELEAAADGAASEELRKLQIALSECNERLEQYREELEKLRIEQDWEGQWGWRSNLLRHCILTRLICSCFAFAQAKCNVLKSKKI